MRYGVRLMVEVTNEQNLGVPPGRYYTMVEFSIVQGVYPVTVRQWKKRGRISTVQLFGKTYVPESMEPTKGTPGRRKKGLKNL